jgi:hypothetical protein
MVVIQVQVGKNFIEDVLLDGGFKVNIITKNLRMQLGLSKLKPTPYSLCMVDQTIARPLGLIKDLKIIVHGILYAVTFTMIQSSVLDFSYSMLLGCPWLRDAKLSHDWGNNIIIIQGMGTIRIIPIAKKLGTPIKHPKVLVCYDFHYGIFNEEKDFTFAIEPRLISIGPIYVPTLVKSEL